MLSDLLARRKTINFLGCEVTLKKLPVRFREWAALRLYELVDGKAQVRASYDDVLTVNVETLLLGVVSIDGEAMTRELAQRIATEAPELADALLEEIQKFSTLNDEAKKN